MSAGAFRLVRSAALADEPYRAIGPLLARVKELAAGAPLRLGLATLGRVRQPNGACIAVHAGAALIGYVFASPAAWAAEFAADAARGQRRPRLWNGREDLEAGGRRVARSRAG